MKWWCKRWQLIGGGGGVHSGASGGGPDGGGGGPDGGVGSPFGGSMIQGQKLFAYYRGNSFDCLEKLQIHWDDNVDLIT